MEDRFIGLLAEDKPALVVGLLAILKSGNAFVPINPIFPNDRIHFILNDCNIEVLVADSANYSRALQVARESSVIRHVLCIDCITGNVTDKQTSRTGPVHLKEKEGAAQFPCYVIYTSGSTGKPKGVPITHRNLVPLLQWFCNYFQLGEHTRIMHNLSYTFDFGVFEILTTVISGGSMYMLDKKEVGDFRFYTDFIENNCINTIHTTPAFFNSIVSTGKKMLSLEIVHLGGENVTGGLVARIAELVSETCGIYNGYGPTEATINCSIHLVTPDQKKYIAQGENIPIGKPSALNRIYILDRCRRLQPIGVPGELCVAGEGLAYGYLNRPELTAERFIKNRSYRSYRTYIFYHTGDLARWLPSGNIEYLGRIDQQVKIRGYRIELGEIENRLLKSNAIKEAVVIDRQDEGRSQRYLCAYIIPREGAAGENVTVSELREFLLTELPEYMIPAYFIKLEKIPLTANGKIDRRALPRPTQDTIMPGVDYTAPADETEQKMALIWQEILGIERIGREDDFFASGGDSILATQCIARLREVFKSEISLRKMFECPTIKALAKEVASRSQEALSIKKIPRNCRIPLSFSQERLWFLQELDAGNAAYFVPRVIMIKGDLDVTLMERTFTEMIRRHEILRTVFIVNNGEVEQQILQPFYFYIPVMDWSGLGKEEQEKRVSSFIDEEGRLPFDFQHGPLLRVTLLKLKEREHLFVLTEHHLIHDGWTQGVLLNEFITIFTAYAEGREHGLPELPIQYADYAVWQRNLLKGDILEQHLAYWKEKLSGLLPVLELPADRPRPAIISGNGDLRVLTIPPSLTISLKQFSKEQGATLFMTMLAVFKVFLYRYTGVEDLCVGIGIANRRLEEMEGMLGMVINTLPLRTQAAGEISFRRYLQLVKNTCLGGYQHEDTPFGKIVEMMRPERSLSYSPLFQVLFTFMDTPGGELRLPGLELELLPTHNRSAKFDINVVVVPPPENEGEDSGEILVEWEYNTDIFDPPTAERMVSHYRRLLEEGLNQPETSITTLPMLSDTEMSQVLYEFNNTEAVYPQEKTIHQLFEEQVEGTPDSIALVGADLRVCPNCLTYRQLHEQSNQLAYLLIEKGVLVDSIVGIMMDRSVELISGILGILKAGGAYMPIDPAYPGDRINYMLKDSNAKILINKSEIRNPKSETNPNDQKINVQNKNFEIPFVLNFEALNFEFVSNFVLRASNLTPSNLAYIIYTSGTTGKPKGSLIEHRNVVRLLFNNKFQFDFTERDIWTIFHSFCFDFSVWEMYGALLLGGKAIIVPKMTARDTAEFLGLLARETVTILNQTPSAFYNLINEALNHPRAGKKLYLRYVIFGGEALTPLKLKVWQENYPKTKLINMFGITETTVHVTYKEIRNKDIELNISNIGNPIPTLGVYILDMFLKPAPVGVPGEICVGGKGVGRGYLNRVELTTGKFIENPYQPGDRLYRSGDTGRFFENGEIEYLGRIDHQVKIRGFRIELEEIRSQLLRYGEIKEAVVITGEAAGEKYLCAYIVSDAEPSITGLRTYLSG
ncbi:MAG: hypothetical protein QG657_4525, partial [Acidobacteriota bacterium]|nr:hypothetical protein [Acidobacteriota bacterium]